jgi:predicted GH43/DUF377 family glycosyl hydrolase
MNLVERSVSHDGKLAPIAIEGTFGGMNPSIYIDDDGDILVNVRVVNYILYHSENKQRFPSRWGPLSYLHPEKDQRLVTENYLCRLNDNLELINSTKVEMMSLHQPIWEFVGLEDARLVQWEGQYYLIGVRRDTTTHGQGRMEYTHITLDKDNWTARETKRVRIPAIDETSYCEKNWYPVIDKPYHFIKWTAPTELVKADPSEPKIEQVSLRKTITPPADQRGSSQLIPWGNMYISISHEVNLFKNYLEQKDGIYRHRLILWDRDFNLVGMSKEFSFLDGRIEFCVGAAKIGDDLLLSFGFQDNCAFVLRVPKLVVEDLILEAL